MKVFNRLSLLFIACTLFVGKGLAQKNYAKEALFAYKDEKYFDAKEKFKIAAERENKKLDKKAMYLFLCGECYRQIVQPDQAEFYYNKALEAGYKNPDIYWWLGNVQQQQANDKLKDKFRDAEKSYTTYYQKSGDKRGEKMAESCKKSLEWISSPTRHIITNEAVINSSDYDFSPTFMDRKGEVLLFSSGRAGSAGAKNDPHTGDNFTDLWTTTRDKKGKWAEPQLLKEVINTPDNEGAGVLDSKRETIYFTRCPRIDDKNMGCQLCESELKGKNWTEAKIVANLKTADSISIGHPALSKDNNVMIFAASSNMGDGQGGKDLWMSTFDRRNKAWTTPVNLGPTINTPGDELFPFLSEEGVLYFSSDGHTGMGGLDIFRAPKDGENKWGKPENLKFPMNSPQNDFGLVLEAGTEDRGFFSSNRVGTKGRDDIWSFVLPPVLYTLTVEVKNLDGDAPIADANVKLVGTDNTSYEVKTDANGLAKFETVADKRYINMNTTYTIEVSKKKFVTDDQNSSLKGQISTVTSGVPVSQDYYKVFRLREVTEKTVFHMPLVLYAYDKADLMVDPTGSAKGNDAKIPVNSKDSLNYLYDLMVKNPGWVVQLRSHTDQRGKDAYNLKLSQRRAQACVDYLVKDKGIDPRRLVAKGMGEIEPIVDEATIKAMKVKQEQEVAYQKNRRTDFKIVGFDFDPTK